MPEFPPHGGSAAPTRSTLSSRLDGLKPCDTTDKATAWDAISEKNAIIADLVKALDTTTQRLRDVLIYLDGTGCTPQRMKWAKAARADLDAALAALSRSKAQGG